MTPPNEKSLLQISDCCGKVDFCVIAGAIAIADCAGEITLVATDLPTICASPIANSRGILLASEVKAGLRGW
jgi:hypothetical protein